ncbi:MAG: M14 family metallopeptidase, partial [Candidatus Poribacteria bacterium]|nr:M14 family metallopeptidase [Candidatus Poribacteria bacterium]
MRRKFYLSIGILGLLLTVVPAQAQIISPEEAIGFPVGTDYKLARWEAITQYLRSLATNADRVMLEERGKTTEGLDFVLVTISSPENLANLDRYKAIQRKLADPRGQDETELDRLCHEGKAVVLINCNLHSTEVASSQMAMELAYQLATKDTPQVREILENVIILLIPSTNPDGLNMVVDWYDRTVGTPYEASPMPWLYHKYTGHDNNRDWFMLTQVESQIVTEILYKAWFPEVVYDVHQMGNAGARFIIPPYFDPVNPNIPPLLQRELSLIGAQMALELTAQGYTGVLSNAVYDTWWNGGFRTVPYRHNMVGILTEAASVNIASPIFQPRLSLKGHRRGLGGYAQQTNFPEPWPGGWWRLRDIIEYEEVAVYSILSRVAKQKVMFLSNFYKLGLHAVEKGKGEPPRAFLVPTKQRDLNTALKMLEILQRGGVEIHRADASFIADGVEYPEGTYVVSMAQPFRAHAKDFLEVQRYPQRRAAPGAPPERPYDITGWTVPLQMGVKVVRVVNTFDADLTLLEEIPKV